MLYILTIIIGVFIFISIFYTSSLTLLIALAIFFLITIIIQKSIFKAIKRFFYILPYFVGVLILQSITPRGEFYSLFGLKLDKTGLDFTILYFTKIITILYFLTIFFFVIKKIHPPKYKIFNELLRVSIFMEIIKKSFFSELRIIKNNKSKLFEKLPLVINLINNVYVSSFKNYPYDEYLLRLKK